MCMCENGICVYMPYMRVRVHACVYVCVSMNAYIKIHVHVNSSPISNKYPNRPIGLAISSYMREELAIGLSNHNEPSHTSETQGTNPVSCSQATAGSCMLNPPITQQQCLKVVYIGIQTSLSMLNPPITVSESGLHRNREICKHVKPTHHTPTVSESGLSTGVHPQAC